MEIHTKRFHSEVTDIWLAYYHELTGKSDKPHYSYDGCLLHWIAEYSPGDQTALLHICYEAGLKAGHKKGYEKAKKRYKTNPVSS